MAAANENLPLRLIRLNAITNPAQPAEAYWLRQYGLEAVQIEANAPSDIIAHAADCDILFVVATALLHYII